MVTAMVASVAMVLWMAIRDPLPRGVLWGSLIAITASGAWVAWLVPRSSDSTTSWTETPMGKLNGERWPLWAYTTLALSTFLIGAAIGGYDRMPITILVSLIWFVPPAIRRPGLAVLLIVSVLYLPMLGAYGLWDPWETHYSEVAREILARNDWISLWWAQDNWFWSKPALLFWAEAWSMGVAGVNFMPDANPAHPEWAIRMPTFAITIVALATVYQTVKTWFGDRAGALSALVVATMPQFFLISHQAITDLPLAAAITVALCCLLLAVHEDPDREVARFRIGPFVVSAQHALLFLIFIAVLPQAAYLISRNISWIDGWHLVAHPDRFLYGSAGNGDVPGNPALHDQLPALRGFWGQPFLQGMLWLGCLYGIALIFRAERRRQALLMGAFYVACAIGFLAKGLLGLAIPGLVALLYLVVTQRWRLLSEGNLRVSSGALLVLAIGFPWYLAMYVRHGQGFTNRLLIHDHINRLASGVHGDGGTVGYFVTQIGYAAFPWVAIAPVVLVAFVRHRNRLRTDNDARAGALVFFALWMLSSFVLFSAMMTKFHHYILPAIVPGGVLIGIALAELWGPKRPRATMWAIAAALFLVSGFAVSMGDPRGIVPAAYAGMDDWVLRQGNLTFGIALLSVATLCMLLARSALRTTDKVDPLRWSSAISVAAVLGACVASLVGRDLSWATEARPQGDQRLIDLFIYNYDRIFPEHLDYRAVFGGFAVAATVLMLGIALPSWRSASTRAFMGVAILFCAWGLDVYMIDLSEHWSFRDLAGRYYEERGDPAEPLIAWQMNWKGENFYTGNRVHAFPALDNKELKKWLEDNEGSRAFFVFEHKRYTRFKELVADRPIRELSTKRDCNKFLLIELEI